MTALSYTLNVLALAAFLATIIVGFSLVSG